MATKSMLHLIMSLSCPTCEEGFSHCQCEINHKIQIVVDFARNNLGWSQETTLAWMNAYSPVVGMKPIDSIVGSNLISVIERLKNVG